MPAPGRVPGAAWPAAGFGDELSASFLSYGSWHGELLLGCGAELPAVHAAIASTVQRTTSSAYGPYARRCLPDGDSLVLLEQEAGSFHAGEQFALQPVRGAQRLCGVWLRSPP